MPRTHDNSHPVRKRATQHSRNVGLARALSKLGYCSRSQAAEAIRAGRVALNGRVRLDPETPVNLEHDSVTVDSQNIAPPKFVYVALNKPRGIVTTASDERGRATVYDLLPSGLPWISPVGRLDKASEGLLLLTNDTEWAARITAPESHLDKIYHVQIDQRADDHLLARIQTGVSSQGELLRAKRARIVRLGKRNSWIEVLLDEGRNRQIRRMLQGLNIGVLRLIRIAIGPIDLGALPKGSCRPLTAAEKQELDSALGSR